MGKIVKYCNSCEEGFAEKFGFCPNCGDQLQAFEMVSPIGNTYIPQNQKNADEPEKAVEEVKREEIPAPNILQTSDDKTEIAPAAPLNLVEESPVIEEEQKPFAAKAEIADAFDEPDFQAAENVSEEPEFVEEPPKTYAAAASAGNSGAGNSSISNFENSTPADDGFYVTVIEEKNAKQRNVLLLGALALVTFVLLGSWAVSLFNKDFLVGSIDQEGYFALIPEIEPVQMEEEPPPKKDNDKGGGGGGGGRDEDTPVQKGRLADQTREKILIAPDKSITQVTNPAIPIKAQTQGDIKRPITDEPYGLPNATGVGSNGQGRGGGMGSGIGTGMGTGQGSGEGSGIGSGSGSGNGPGNGGGTGAGGGGKPPPPPPSAPAKPKITTAMKITSKPRPGYTDAARQNNVQGQVTLRVTFNANGTIGNISPVSGLPYGLTEQAIAAARNIRFEPQLVDGVPKSVTKTLQFSFSIY